MRRGTTTIYLIRSLDRQIKKATTKKYKIRRRKGSQHAQPYGVNKTGSRDRIINRNHCSVFEMPWQVKMSKSLYGMERVTRWGAALLRS